MMPADTKAVEARKDRRRAQLMKAIELPTHAGVSKELAAAYEKIVAGQRKAHGLDDGQADTTVYEELRKVLDGA